LLKKIYRKLLPLRLRKAIGFTLTLPKQIYVFIVFLLTNWRKFKYELSIAAIVKNEGPYIREWLEYHRIVGVEHFYLYDNESTDNLKDILQPYIEKGIVTYTWFPGILKQKAANNDAIKRFKFETKWMAIIDIDEFIVPVHNASILEALDEIKTNLKKRMLLSLKVHWIWYGYSEHKAKPAGLVIENYTKSAGMDTSLDPIIKSIVNPRTIIEYHCHHGEHFFGIDGVNEAGIKIRSYVAPGHMAEEWCRHIRINHYYTKSYEEFTDKIKRGRAYTEGEYEIPLYDPEWMSKKDETIMEKYVPLVKARLAGPVEKDGLGKV